MVFVNSKETKIDRHNLRRAFNIAVEKAGIEGFHFHDLRHTFATRLTQGGADLYMISKLLGHQDIRMTQRYAHHCSENLRTAIQVLEVGHNSVIVDKNRNVLNG
ncbi:MAG: site-specific integrase [Candidatus Jettenia caeni]|nr:MAG: site-specific integrase [Candidatus Jettenia caeni]